MADTSIMSNDSDVNDPSVTGSTRASRFSPGIALALHPQVKKREALAFLGYKGSSLDHDLQSDLASSLDDAVAMCQSEMHAKGTFRIFDVEGDGDRGNATGIMLRPCGLELPGVQIVKHLEGCAKAALMAVTLGASSEMVLGRERVLSLTFATIVDACASSLVEQAANELDRAIAHFAARSGMQATRRFSPGYGDLPLNIQPALLDCLHARTLLGIETTSSDLMMPQKSITAIIGLSDHQNR